MRPSSFRQSGSLPMVGCVLAALLTLAILPAPVVAQAPVRFEAELVADTTQRDVRAADARWRCRGRLCVSTDMSGAPDARRCALLAAEVGPVKRFGHARARLTSAQIDDCNRAVSRIAAAMPPTSSLIAPSQRGLGAGAGSMLGAPTNAGTSSAAGVSSGGNGGGGDESATSGAATASGGLERATLPPAAAPAAAAAVRRVVTPALMFVGAED